MYFVNRSEIEQKLSHMDTLLEIVENASMTTEMEKLGFERVLHVVIESIIDVGNLMIDGFIMRDPGSYHDIIDILIDEQVLPDDVEASFKALIDLRQNLVQDYLHVDHQQIKEVLDTHFKQYKHFSTHVRTYLEKGLNVANAFSNESYKGGE